MIPVRTVEVILSFITIAIAYIVSTTLAGYAQAWVAWRCGDSSAKDSGFLSFNPFVHIDPIGAFCLLFFGVGWGSIMPIQAETIRSRWQLFLVFLTKPFVYSLTALVSLLALLVAFDVKILHVTMLMVLSDFVSLSTLTKLYPESSSFVLALAMILVMAIYIGVMFCVLTFILNMFRFALIAFLHRTSPLYTNDFLLFLVPFLLMVLFSRPLKVCVVYGITYVVFALAPYLGALIR